MSNRSIHSSDAEENIITFDDNIDIEQIANSDQDSNSVSSKSSQSYNKSFQQYQQQPKPEINKNENTIRKLDLLTTLSSYKSNGHYVQNMGINTPLEELEYEVHRVKKISQVKNNVDVYKKMLLSGVGGIEMINNFSPKKFALSGWSRNFANKDIHDCESYLQQIAEEEGQLMDPRWMLIITVIGSGVSYHFSKSFAQALGNSLGNSLGDDIMKGLSDNPDLLKNLMKKSDKGPSFDLDADDISIVSSDDTDSEYEGVNVGPSTPTPTPKKRKYNRKKKLDEKNSVTI